MNSLNRSTRPSFSGGLKVMVMAALLLSGVYILFSIISSGIIPLFYAVIAGLLWLVISAVVAWLLFRRFHKFNVVAKIIGVIMTAGALLASYYGMTVFSGTVHTINTISKNGTVQIASDKPFYVFISGIDTYGDIAVQSRSDVNILAAVNPTTHVVTLVTVPRDSYVPIALGGNDQYDKLTHAGNYGVESSMETIANLFDIDIDAYVRVNFTSFVKGIDRLGGITVQNPVAFDSFGEHFPAGGIHLTGERALMFSRERKSLPGGDLDRGQNQQLVISAVIQKASSIRDINSFQGLLAFGQEAIQTNMTNDTIYNFINKQVSRPAQWRTKSLELTGHGETGTRPSYAMPSAALYMYILDEESVQQVKYRLSESTET